MNRTTLLHYHITAKLGEGGMGEVYRAMDTKLGREVAIKVLPASFSRDPRSLARFEREAKALAALNHPHIAGIYGFEADQGTHFLVLELVEGETLSERLWRGPLPVKEALEAFDKSLDLSPDFLPAYSLRGQLFLAQKKIPEAIAELEKVRKKEGDTPYALGSLGHAYARIGRMNQARQILEKLKKVSERGGAASVEIARVNLGLGEIDQAFVMLERAVESRDLDPRFLKSEPLFDDITKDPRYAALLKKHGLDK